MIRTAIVFSSKYLDHNPGLGHPESPKRLRVIMKELKNSGLLETGKCLVVQPNPANIEDLKLVHESDYVQLVKRVCDAGGGLLDLSDTRVSSQSYEVARLAVGGAIKAVDLIMAEKFQNAFALVRPPGHHAGRYYAMGFCIFNNVAVAATHLLSHFNLNRIAVLDIDSHHGNATQEIFYDSDKVLYIGLHEDPTTFPVTGFTDEIGEGKGLGYTVNVPFPYLVGDYMYLKAFDQIVVPIVKQYRPQFILVSAGFDGHFTDPVAELALSTFSYVDAFGKILELASELCRGKIVAVLEGGYSLRFLGKMATAVIAEMAGIPYSVQDKHEMADTGIQKQAEKVIEEVRLIQSSFWNL
jgi:acetoin utilization deacetylase AcuC-like enzyme